MEKGNVKIISVRENRRLSIHIFICRWCKAYNEKIKLLDRIIRKKLVKKNTEMSEADIQDFKNEMIKKITFGRSFNETECH